MPTFRSRSAGRPAILVLLAILAILIAACGSSSSQVLSTVGSAVDSNAYAGAAEADGAFPSAAASAAPAAAVPGDGTGGRDVVGAVDDARIVRTGTMQLEVTDVAKAVATARTLIRGMGGYVGASNTTNDADQPTAAITYRIPVDRWEDALAALRSLNGQTTKIVTEQTQAVEVTGQIVDLQARIKNLRASEASLQAIALKANRISDVLEVEQQLTDVRGQIEVLAGQLAQISNQADLATLTVTFGVPVVAVQVARQGWDPATVVDEASASMVGVLQGLASAGIWFGIVWLPILIVLGVLAALVAWFVRRTGLLRRSVPPVPPVPPVTPTPPTAPIAS